MKRIVMMMIVFALCGFNHVQAGMASTRKAEKPSKTWQVSSS